LIGEVVWVTCDSVICDEQGSIDPLRLGAIARLGPRTFLRTTREGAHYLARTPWSGFVANDKET